MPSISLPAIGTAIAAGAADIGIPAAIAGTIGSVAAPALVGAGVGGLTAAVTGGKVLKGMGYGALAGGTLGGAGVAFPETMGALGIQGLGTAGVPGAVSVTPEIMGSNIGGYLGGAEAPGALEAATGLDPAMAAAYGVPDAASAAPGMGGAAAPAASSSFPWMKALNLAGALGQGLTTPAAPNYGLMPGPATTAATRGPLFDQPISNFGGTLNRTPTQNYAPLGGDWYRYGTEGNQPSFYQGYNGLRFPGQPGAPSLSPLQTPLRMAHGGALARAIFEAGRTHGMARGGALSRTFSTENGENAVRGPGTGTSDSIPAQLSNGEYVLTEKDVSRIGKGKNSDGAHKLDVARRAGAKKIPQLLSKARAA